MGSRTILMALTTLISFPSLIFPAIFLAAAGNQPTPHPHNVCAEQKCSPDGPPVKFPFVLLGKQPENCGYNSSYNLHCDQFNRTILELPSSSLKLVVTNISYLSQTIQVQSLETCFAKQLGDLDISTTPFQVLTSDGYGYYYIDDQYSLFNCSFSGGRRSDYFMPLQLTIDCLQNDGYQLYTIPRHVAIWEVAESLKSCTKMYDTKWVSEDILSSNIMNLSWYSSPPCRRCQVQGGIYGYGNQFGSYRQHPGILKILRISGPTIGCFLLATAIGAIIFVYFKMEKHKEDQMRIEKFLKDYAALKPTRYSFADIKKITNDFKDKLGEGGYGNVFKGQVSNEIFVAVKLLHNSTENGEEFVNEVGTMGTIHHVNVVRLLGFCADGYKRALVYEFLPNGSLDKFIFPNGQTHHTLGMARLQDIAIGIARGIYYLHQGCELRILHFDIKPHNILLDENYNPKISDFGLAKLCEKGRSVVSMTAARGTMGYIAPEVFSRQFGNVSYKSDIYSFGMLLLEMVGRRKNIDANVQNVSQVYFPEWVYGRLATRGELRIQIEEDGEDQIAKMLAIVGLWCIQWNPVDRPSITFVLQMLEGSGENVSLPPNPFISGIPYNPADTSEHRRPLGSTLSAISELE